MLMKKAFTLVELLIVIVIIGILATLAVPQYNKMIERARGAEAKSILGALARANLAYYYEHGDFAGLVYDGVQPPYDNNSRGLAVDFPTNSKYWNYNVHKHTSAAADLGRSDPCADVGCIATTDWTPTQYRAFDLRHYKADLKRSYFHWDLKEARWVETDDPAKW